MTNHWVDIKNANVIIVMGGNAAEAHPCGFKWVTEAKAHNDATLHSGGSTLHPLCIGGGPLCAHPYRHGHRLPGRSDQLPAEPRQDPARIRQGLHQRSPSSSKRVTNSTRACSRATTRRTQVRQVNLGLPDRPGRLCQVDATLQNPRCVLAAAKTALFPLHARNGEQHLRHSQGYLPQGVRDHRHDLGARPNT